MTKAYHTEKIKILMVLVDISDFIIICTIFYVAYSTENHKFDKIANKYLCRFVKSLLLVIVISIIFNDNFIHATFITIFVCIYYMYYTYTYIIIEHVYYMYDIIDEI